MMKRRSFITLLGGAVATWPLAAGLVASLNRPGGNVTGITSMNAELGAKRLGLLRELLPRLGRIAVLVSTATHPMLKEVQEAAAGLGLQVEALVVGTLRGIDTAFATLVQKRADALLVGPGPPLSERRVQIATLAARHAVPAIYPVRENVDVGGLMSYGPSIADEFRQVGIYTGRVLKGEKPADLPVMRAAKFEFVINLQTARALRIAIPPTLLASADEVIE